MSGFFDLSHVTDVGMEFSSGPPVSVWDMVRQGFRQQYRVDSARALDDELRTRWLESLSALRTAGQNFNAPVDPQMYRGYAQFVREGTPVTVPTVEGTGYGARFNTDVQEPHREFEEMRRANEAIRALNNPDIKSFEQILEEVSAMQQGVEQQTASMSERGGASGFVGELIGAIGGSFTPRDPLNVVTAPIGAGRTIAARIGTDMLIAAGVVTATEYGDVQPARALAQLPDRNPLFNIAAATLGAGIIRGGIEGIGAGVRNVRGRFEPEDIDFDLRDSQLQQMFDNAPDTPTARAGAAALDDMIFVERNNPYGEGQAAQARFLAELQQVQRAMNGEPMTAIARVLPPVPFEYLQKVADFEIVREQRPLVYARMEQAQASVRAIENRINDGTVPGQLRATRDNPGGDWLARKQRQSLEARVKALEAGETTGIAVRGLTGSTTMTARVRIPVEQLRQLEGVLGERPRAGQGKFDALTKSVEEKGFKQESAVMVWVNHLGEPYVYEGNNRIAVAALNNIQDLEVEIQWRNGAEEVEGPFSVAAVKEALPPVSMPKEDLVRLRAERRAANAEYQTAYRAVEAEAVRLREAQARVEAAQQRESASIFLPTVKNRLLIGPTLQHDYVESLVERINKFNDTLDEQAAARFVREVEGSTPVSQGESPAFTLGKIEHPNTPRVRRVGEALVEINRYREPGMWFLERIESLKRGGGRAAMQQVVKEADRLRVPIFLEPRPFKSGTGLKMTDEKLRQWYEGFGFRGATHRGVEITDDSYASYMVRQPQQIEGEEAVAREAWRTEDGRVDIGLSEPVDPEFRFDTDEGELTVAAAMRDLQDDADLDEAMRICRL